MGLFDFVKDAGERLLGIEDDFGKKLNEPIPQARVDELRKQNIVKMIGEAGLGVQDLNVDVKGEVATLHGVVASQEACEKATLVAGNQHGIAKVDCQLKVNRPAQEAAAAPEAQAAFYTVKKGDTLSAIAKAHYGNAGKYMVIFKANQPMLQDPDKIYPGQVLRIPPL